MEKRIAGWMGWRWGRQDTCRQISGNLACGGVIKIAAETAA